MALSTQSYKGARDFYPEDKRLQKYLFGVLRRVVESFGYQEYDAPVVEPIEIYVGKTSEEILAEQTFNFLDRGGRHVTLRPEMTPSVSRMVAGRRQELSYPLRLYSIPNLWRYERPQKGRLREHYQLNVDLFGVAGLEADHEIILIADQVLQAFGAIREMYEIRLSSRALVNWVMLEYLRLEQSQSLAVMRLIDKKEKMTEDDYKTALKALLSDKQLDRDVTFQLHEIMKAKKIEELPLAVQQHPSVAELKQLMTILDENGLHNLVFSPQMMRGFDYYTDIIFEVFDKNPENSRSMFGGGRYDALVGAFGVEPLPTVGFGMGDVTLQEFIEGHKLMPKLPSEVDAVAILIGDVYKKAQKPLGTIRREGLKVAVDSSGRKVDAQIKSAAKTGVPFVIFIGDKELETERYRIKDLESGKEQDLSLERLVSTIAAHHKRNDEL